MKRHSMCSNIIIAYSHMIFWMSSAVAGWIADRLTSSIRYSTGQYLHQHISFSKLVSAVCFVLRKRYIISVSDLYKNLWKHLVHFKNAFLYSSYQTTRNTYIKNSYIGNFLNRYFCFSSKFWSLQALVRQIDSEKTVWHLLITCT